VSRGSENLNFIGLLQGFIVIIYYLCLLSIELRTSSTDSSLDLGPY